MKRSMYEASHFTTQSFRPGGFLQCDWCSLTCFCRLEEDAECFSTASLRWYSAMYRLRRSRHSTSARADGQSLCFASIKTA